MIPSAHHQYEQVPVVTATNGSDNKGESMLERRLDALVERMDRLAFFAEKSASTLYQKRMITLDIANPAPIGLYAFALATALYMTAQAHITEQSTQFIAFSMGIFLGGLTMLVTGFLELYRKNILGATAFCVYGSFWLTVGVYGIIRTAGIFFLESPNGEQALTILMGFASFTFMIASLACNIALPFLFLNLTIMFFLLAGGVENTTVARVAGWWGIWTSGIALYCGTATLLRDLWGRDVLPQGFTKRYLRAEKVLFPRVHVETDEDLERMTSLVPRKSGLHQGVHVV